MKNRVPVILQTEVAECGLACVAMVLGHMGHETGLDALRKQFDPSTRGTTVKDLARVAESLGLKCKSLRASPAKLRELPLPAILHWNASHYVVLADIKADSYVIHDPALGRRVVSFQEIQHCFTGICQTFETTATFVKQRRREQLRLSWLLGGKHEFISQLGALLAVSFVMQFLLFIFPVSTKLVFDYILESRDSVLLFFIALAGAIGVGTYIGLLRLRSAVVLYLNYRLDEIATRRLVSKIYSAPFDFFSRRNVGGLLNRFSNLAEVRRLLSQGLAESIVDAIVASIILIALASLSPSATVIAVCSLIVYGVLRAIRVETGRDCVSAVFAASGSQYASLLESLTAIGTIKANGLELLRERLWAGRFDRHLNAALEKSRFEYANQQLAIGIYAIGYGLIAWIAARGYFSNFFSPGGAFSILALSAMLFARFSTFLERLFELAVARVHIDKLADVANAETTRLGGIIPNRSALSIEFRNVGFRYSHHEPFVFRHVNFVVHPNECVALVGDSGSGKSTLMSLILGLQEPTEGDILVGGISLRDIDLSSLRQATGSVLQTDHLFTATVADNIALFETPRDDQQLLEVLSACQLDHLISRLPMGMHTMVGDQSTFSGGERQRLLLARALYKQPDLLLLDEASSHLDAKTELAINSHLSGIHATRFMIAHRQNTIALASRVIRLERQQETAWATVIPSQSREPEATHSLSTPFSERMETA